MTVVSIAGMHRSGTSMVARALNLCGMYLGPEEDVLRTAPDNPEGWWEKYGFVVLNGSIVAKFGGAWDLPPDLPKHWEMNPEILACYLQAAGLIEEFSGHKFWGWKDPRNSLTIDFWQRLLPGLKVIVCLRNPLEVAKSLSRPGYASREFGLNLWYAYNQRLIYSVPAEIRLVTHFDAFWENPRAELVRMLRFLGTSPSEAQLESAVASFHMELRHNRYTLLDLTDGQPRSELIDLYQRLCLEAGPMFVRLTQAESSRSGSALGDTSQPGVSQAPISRAAHKAHAPRGYRVLLAALDQSEQELKRRLAEVKDRVRGKIFRLPARVRSLWVLGGSDPAPGGNLVLKALRVWRIEGFRALIHRIYLKYWNFRVSRSKASFTPLSARSILDLQRSAREISGEDYVPIVEQDFNSETAVAKPIAFYLPQFHPIPENDGWWGKGFTEWVNVSKAVPNFVGHYQPHRSGELGLYDLRLPEIQRRQVELAKKYGIFGFCFYYYWFAGKRLLERPLDQYLATSELDLPFCLCWANENWTRRWDGRDSEILIGQAHTESDYSRFIRDISPNFRDTRYIRIDGRPLLLIYRVNLLPNPSLAADIWRARCKEMGIGDIYLAAVQSFGISDPRPYGFDAAVEFPPHHVDQAELISDKFKITNPQFSGKIYDYGTASRVMTEKRGEGYTLFKTVMPSWDNTPRRQDDSHVFVNATPS